MVTFRNNNNRRNNFRRNHRNFKNNVIDKNKFGTNFSSNDNFQRKTPGRNNHNAAKLHEKYNNLAREALSSGDKILSENYFQHADHFTRILNEKEIQKKIFNNRSSAQLNNSTDSLENKSATEKSVGNLDETQSEPN